MMNLGVKLLKKNPEHVTRHAFGGLCLTCKRIALAAKCMPSLLNHPAEDKGIIFYYIINTPFNLGGFSKQLKLS